MKRLIALIVELVLAASVQGQTFDNSLVQFAPEPEVAAPIVIVQEENGQLKQQRTPASFDQVATQALRERKPFVVGVGVTPPQGEWLSATVELGWDGLRKPGVIVAERSGNWWSYREREMLPEDARPIDVRRTLRNRMRFVSVLRGNRLSLTGDAGSYASSNCSSGRSGRAGG